METAETGTRSFRGKPRIVYAKQRTDRFPSLLRGTRNYYIAQVRDANGDLWDVRDARTTKHGFDLFLGIPSNNHGAYLGGPARLITTEALRDFWLANRLKSHGFLFDLPAGRTTLKRARKRLGFNQRHDVRKFWKERIDDLRSMPLRQFARKHDVDTELIKSWRLKLVGSFSRPVGWWRQPETITMLLSSRTLIKIGQELGISISQTHRLRRRAEQEYQSLR